MAGIHQFTEGKTVKQYRDKHGRFIQLRPYGDENMVALHDSAGWTGAAQDEQEAIKELERAGFTFDKAWPSIPR